MVSSKRRNARGDGLRKTRAQSKGRKNKDEDRNEIRTQRSLKCKWRSGVSTDRTDIVEGNSHPVRDKHEIPHMQFYKAHAKMKIGKET